MPPLDAQTPEDAALLGLNNHNPNISPGTRAEISAFYGVDPSSSITGVNVPGAGWVTTALGGHRPADVIPVGISEKVDKEYWGEKTRQMNEAAQNRAAMDAVVKSHKPVSQRQANKLLTKAILTALKTRPDDFIRYGDTLVRDQKTGQVWSVNGDMPHSTQCGCTRVGQRLGFWQRAKVGSAVAAWLVAHPPAPVMTPQQEEAIKLMHYNKA